MATFREIPLIPVKSELCSTVVHPLPPNDIDKRYANVEQYLDTHFRLLREDCVRPLRQLVTEWLEKWSNKDEDVSYIDYLINGYVYNRVIVYETYPFHDKLCVKLNLDTSSLSADCLMNSRRLLYGSLLCFSWNHFEDFIIGTVSMSPQKTEKRAQNGYLEVKVDTESGNTLLKALRSIPDIRITILEPVVYYEAYRHNLRILQLLNNDSFPFKKYIVELDNQIQPPQYLTEDTTIDLSHFLSPLNVDGDNIAQNDIIVVEDHLMDVKLLNTDLWPSYNDLRIDESQYNSLKQAFLHELALIQGPPGTGKTHIGLRIVQTLMANLQVWDPNNDRTICVVCYTNHALDQFLEGVLKFTNRIVRIGGRSKSMILKNFTIKQLRANVRGARLNFNSMLEEDLFYARHAKIIGATTTGAAKYRELISRLQPKIVIAEEAAEILESHLITSIPVQTEHLILIGDHNQLRPSTSTYELAVDYNLQISMFERLVRNNLSYSTLKVQHRMQPNIAKLLVPIFYDELENHDNVSKYEQIRGVVRNVFFIGHKFAESTEHESTSPSNVHERNFVVALCRYLVFQGYNPSRITVLAMYSRQCCEIQRAVDDTPELIGLRVAVVDNFQGEENDIIILSFVRSNEDGYIGFLRVPNRVNVALSRAKLAFYAIGNFEKMAQVSKKLWNPLLKQLVENENFGYSLELRCPNHTEITYFVSKDSDFPNASCSKPCNRRLDCGHMCPKLCHFVDSNHSNSKCIVKCLTLNCDNGHRCQKQCHFPDACGPCSVPIAKTRICGHTVKISCSTDESKVICSERCVKWISCGHRCPLTCGQKCSKEYCKVMVDVLPPCGHSMIPVPCNKKHQSENFLKLCKEPCKTVLKCGHQCSGTCSDCKQGRFHKRCNEKCGRVLMCGHICKHPCVKNCPPCTARCQNTCNHEAFCDHNCGSRCPPCAHDCLWRCKHLTCTMLCSEPCDRDFCNKSCNKKLPCGHDCIGLCGDPCPKWCRFCNKEEVEEIFFGNENDPNAKFVQLIDCGHIFEFDGIKTYLRKTDYQIRMKPCPKCQKPIRRSFLFNREIQAVLADIERVKEKTSVTATFTECFHGVQRTKKIAKNALDQLQLQFVLRPTDKVFQKLVEVISNQLDAIENPRIFFLKPELSKINTIVEVCDNILHTYDPIFEDNEITLILSERIIDILTFVTTDFDNNDQQNYDLQKEVVNILHVGKCMLLYINSNDQNEEFDKLFSEALILFCNPCGLNDESCVYLKELLNKAFKIKTGIGISIEETRFIMKAMNFTYKGHWFKCPENHVYCITECGGAEQTSICPECKSLIGGAKHRLLASNSVATEMDGATTSAYNTLAMQARFR